MELGQVASRGAVTELVERLREEQENTKVGGHPLIYAFPKLNIFIIHNEYNEY